MRQCKKVTALVNFQLFLGHQTDEAQKALPFFDRLKLLPPRDGLPAFAFPFQRW